MIQVLHFSNPYQPTENLTRGHGYAGQSINEWLLMQFGPEFTEFDLPTLCQLNGVPLLREKWSKRLREDDNLVFITLPGEPVTIIIAIVAVVVAVAAYLLIPDPRIPADTTDTSSSAYTLRGQTNRLRPNEPVEVIYGKCRVWPTFISRPYSRYKGNLQYQYSLFCVGQGHYDLTSLRLDDTNIGAYNEVEIEICPPGTPFTLVEGAVYHALEVSNIELLGPNEDDYDGASGPFILNEWDNPIRRIEHDVSFPQGLYKMTSSGKLGDETVELLFEHKEIGQFGGDIGVWTETASPVVVRKDNTPQRVTISTAVTSGRYKVRARRITPKSESTRSVSQVRWEDCKGYARFKGDLGNVTVICMKALATNKLNDQTSQSFNLLAQRLLPKWTELDGWGPSVATRNPVWAFCDLFRAKYGARIETKYLNMPVLLELANKLETREDWFDWIFDQTIGVWEAGQMILRVGRSVPIPIGSLVSAVRDRAQSNPTAFFNAYNIVKGTLTKKLSMFEFNPFDSLLVEYTHPNTWKTQEILCVLEGREGINPDRLKLPGCTNRHRAHREGLYIQSRRELQRKTVTFQTGLEGHIPTHLDLIAITHDTIRIGQGGFVLAYNSGTEVATLSEQVTFGGDLLVHQIAFRASDGSILGNPINCSPGPAANKVVLEHGPDEPFDFTGNQVPPLYGFGVKDLWTFYGQVMSIKPIDSKSVEITAVNYVPSSHTTDDAVTVDAIEYPTIQNSSSPEVKWVTLSPVPDVIDRVFVDWRPVTGAAGYILETTYDDTNWSPAGTYPTMPVQLAVNQGTLRVRVAPFAIGGNVRYTSSNLYVVGSNIEVPPRPISTAQVPFVGLTATATWLPVSAASGYSVEVWRAGGVVPLRTIDAGTSNAVDYTRAEFEADSPLVNSRDITFKVAAVNAGGTGPQLVLLQSNPVPLAPTELTAGTPAGTVYPVSWTHTPEADFLSYKVYASTSAGFTPGPGNLVATVTSPASSIAATVATYWRAAAVDVWGEEESMSVEALIP